MNLGRIAKAISAGLTTAVTGEGMAILAVSNGAALPDWAFAAVPVINFALGFAAAYYPTNKP